jgi:hypothetical protein
MVDEAAPERESIPEPIPSPFKMSVAEQLERGHPGEFLPGSRELELMKRAAEKYLADQSMPPDGRQRVRAVWLQNRYVPAYQRFTPRKREEPAVTADDFG